MDANNKDRKVLRSYFFPIFLLQFEQAFGTQTAIVQFRDMLHFVYTELHHAALAFGISIGFALNSRSASFAWNDFVFGAMYVCRHFYGSIGSMVISSLVYSKIALMNQLPNELLN